MNASWRRRLAALLAVVMLISLVPTVALAAERMEEAPTQEQTAAEPFSLLPLEEKWITVDMGDINPLILQSVKVSDLLASEIQDSDHPDRPLKGTEKVAWVCGGGGAYEVVDITSTIDLFPYFWYTNSQTFSIVVGSGKQLDHNNVRYIVNVLAHFPDNWIVPTVYRQGEDGSRSPVNIKDFYMWDNKELEINVLEKTLNQDEAIYLGLSFDEKCPLDGHEIIVKRNNGNEEVEDVTNAIWNPDLTQKDAGYATHLYSTENFTITLSKNGEEIASYDLSVTPYQAAGSSVSYGYLHDGDNNNIVDHMYNYFDASMQEWIYTYTLYSEYPANNAYSQSMYFFLDGERVTPSNSEFSRLLAVKGYYKTLTEAKNAVMAGKAVDIKEELFGDGYKTNYSSPVFFSIFYDEESFHFGFQAVTGPNSKDYFNGNNSTLFRLTGTAEYTVDADTRLDSYIIPLDHDSYYFFGYETALVLKENLDLSRLKPYFGLGDGVKVYAGTPAVEQKSGESIVDFSNGPVQYTTVSENAQAQNNYYVTIVGKSSNGASLFINGANGPKEKDGTIRRELFLDGFYGRVHDIFLANIGSEALSGLKVELSDAKNVKLDEYWTVGGEGNDTLAPFTKTYSYSAYAELDNVAKIRLVPDGEGEISGKLSITYGVGQDTMVFTLTGQAGDPKITTAEIPVGVKYVPYGTVIQNSNTYDWNKVSYTLQSGKLPKGVELMPNGELYGVPQETGKFSFRVCMKNSSSYFTNSYATFTLEVQDNTSENVAAQTDTGYEVSGLPDKMTSYTDQTFKSEGAMGEFVALWLDGKKLTEGVDYEKSEGSTVITANSKLFRDAGRGDHTMAFEFRVNGDVTKDLKKGAKNYTAPGSSSSGSSNRRPSNRGETSATTVPAKEFIDVPKDAWFYDEVQWAVKNNTMIGTSENTFAPNTPISQAMVTTVMARMAGVDLSKYADVTGTNLLADQWYTNASVWAWQGGIVGEGSFSALEPITRGELAVMLMRYLNYRAVACPKPATPAEFADAVAMTTEESDAFQALYAAGILKGVGDNYMAPDRSTSRVELAIIAHRLTDYFAKH